MNTQKRHITWIKRSILGMLVVGGIANGAVSEAATYYVSKSGSNSNSCSQAKSSSSAKNTILAGIDCLSAGDTLIVSSGTYGERISNAFPGGTSWSNKTTLRAKAGDTVVIQPSGGENVMRFTSSSQKFIEIDGVVIDGAKTDNYGVQIWDNAHHIRLINVEIRNNSNQGVSVLPNIDTGASPTDNEFINCNIHHTQGHRAGYTHGMYIGTDRNLVENCELHDNDGFGIQFYVDPDHGVGAPDDCVIKNTRVYNNSESGIAILWGKRNKAINNIVWNNGNWGIITSGSDTGIYNNTIYDNGGNGIRVFEANGVDVHNNIVYSNNGNINNEASGTSVSHNLTSNPNFENPGSGNFKLKSNSAAIDGGMMLASEVDSDIDGIARPQGSDYDIGAHEFGNGGPVDNDPPAPPTNLEVASN